MSKKCIGIDLGTTNSCVSVMEGNNVTIIPNSDGGRTTPSIVAFTKTNERLIGEPAKRQAVTNPGNTIFSIKRFMGRRYDEISSELKNIAYNIVEDNHLPKVNIDDKKYTPQEISAMILQKMKKTAEDFVGETIIDAVITVPAYFNDAQRQATKEAGEIAGLNVKRIINEPTAAALAYGLDKKDKNKLVAVFDTGGGTHDFSILEIGDGVFEVKASNGDGHLGGDDFDHRLVEYIISEFNKKEGIDLSKDLIALQRIKDAAETAKKQLSTSFQAEINLPYITATTDGPKFLLENITRAKFESLISDLVERTIEPCRKAIKDANINISDIDEVILVGGSTRIPIIQQKVKEFFGKEANKSVNPDEVVSMGAAIQGAVLNGDVQDVLLLDVTPLSLGLETMGGVMTKLIEANTTIPTKKSQIFSTAIDNQPSVEIHVLQGERSMAQDNRTLGKFHLDGIPPAPRGIPQIEVSFDIDANGILQVSAKDSATGKEQNIKISNSSGLSKEEIEKMKKDAKEHENEDNNRKEMIDIKNQADTMVFQGEKQLNELSDKMTPEDTSSIQSKLDNLKEKIKTDNFDSIKSAIDEYQSIWSKISEKMYNQAKPNDFNSEKKQESNVETADYEVVK